MIRTFKSTDTDALIELWNRATPDHPIDKAGFVKNILLDPNFDEEGFFLVEREGELVAFLQAVIRKVPVDVGGNLDTGKGYINVIGFADPADALGKLGLELLSRAEKYIAGYGEREIRVAGYTPNYFYPGINEKYTEQLELFRRAGYTEGSRHRSIEIDLLKYEYPVQLQKLKAVREAEGYGFSSLTPELVRSMLAGFVPGWVHRFRRQLLETMDYSKFRVITFGGEVVGCSVFGDPYSSHERFGPIGVHSEYRGLGLGKLLLADTLVTMKESGLRHAWAQSTPMSGAARTMYDRAGFYTTATFLSFVK